MPKIRHSTTLGDAKRLRLFVKTFSLSRSNDALAVEIGLFFPEKKLNAFHYLQTHSVLSLVNHMHSPLYLLLSRPTKTLASTLNQMPFISMVI